MVAQVRSKASANLPGVDMIDGDARDEGTLIRALNGCDGVVSSLGTTRTAFSRFYRRNAPLPSESDDQTDSRMRRVRRYSIHMEKIN